MRCFVAVTVGARITGAVAEAVGKLRAVAERGRLKLSWVREEGWHVTLKFLGEISDAQRDEAARRLSESLAGAGAFDVSARGLMTLPRPAVPRVLAVALHDDGSMAGLAATVARGLEPMGFERDERPFVPHITIARIRDQRASFRHGRWRTLGAAVEAMDGHDFGAGRVDSVDLYRSHLGQGGSRYELLERVGLGTARPACGV